MVVVGKKDNTPRRTVNFQFLNRFAAMQTHFTAAPFHKAMACPAGIKKSVLDTWNGYHSMALDARSWHLTTLITPWGRYRYCTMPQGYLAAGDAYTDRYDRIVKDVRNKKCIYDMLLWSTSVEGEFNQVCDYLLLCASNGIVFNLKMFVFCEDAVEFAGFEIGPSLVKPGAKVLEAIHEFLEPKTISNIRGWFSLINQVALFYAVCPVIEPFRALLKPPEKGNRIYWDTNSSKLIRESKEVILWEIMKGIRTFNMRALTCLLTNWSKFGMGYMLMQKRCRCQEINLHSCKGGWA